MSNSFFHRKLYLEAFSRSLFGSIGVLLTELRYVIPQFLIWWNPLSYLRVIKYILVSFLRVFFGRSVRLSYAHTGEDRIIESLLNKSIKETGTYIDVGCNHPTFINNTFSLYRKGWKGVCVDGNSKLIKKYRWYRPQDKAIASIVSTKGELVEYIEYTNNVLSSIDEGLEEVYKKEGQEVVSRTKIVPRKLTEILDEQDFPTQFDLLTIDAEEHDFEVLLSLDLAKYQPRLVVMELEDLDINNTQQNECVKYLKDHNYHLVGYVLKNAYFLRAT